MDRRKTLATVGAISLTASAAVVALGSSMGLFGLTDESPNVGKLSPIDATQPARTTTKTIIVNDPVPSPIPGSSAGTRTDDGNGTNGPRTDDDPAGHDANDDRLTTSTTTNTVPEVNDDRGSDDDNRGPGSSPAEDNSGPGSSSSGHDDDDD